ncbi:hypothetical protein, partial [Bacteriovorax sp. DB6_IX]|uniref:hypothetical protein n=1 Tax=Bacteriovorax sp. DB6_IX TaxID=1353530 RepID=UPI0005541D14
SEDKPEEKIFSKLISPYKGKMYLHSWDAISLTWEEVKDVRKAVYKLAPGIFKNTYRYRDCKFYVLETKSFGGCPSK